MCSWEGKSVRVAGKVSAGPSSQAPVPLYDSTHVMCDLRCLLLLIALLALAIEALHSLATPVYRTLVAAHRSDLSVSEHVT